MKSKAPPKTAPKFRKLGERQRPREVFSSRRAIKPQNCVDALKWSICRAFEGYQRQGPAGYNAKQIAKFIGVTEAQMAAILVFRIEMFSLEFLISRLEKMAPYHAEARRAVVRLILAF